jgi:hypothetical protein
MLIYREPICSSTWYTRLQIVPKALFDIVFVAFHSNPLGGYLNAYCTLHHICLRYFWPKMYSYIRNMFNACPGCALSNLRHGKSSELVYHFLIKALFCILFVDAYKAGNHSIFEGDNAYLISCCGMTSFAIMEPIKHTNSQNFASAIMKIQLQFEMCHTIVLDKDSKFFGAFKEACDLLQLNWHFLSGGNHNPMTVKWVSHYLNEGLKVMSNKHGSV